MKKSLKRRPAYASKRRSNLTGLVCQFSPKRTPHKNLKGEASWRQKIIFFLQLNRKPHENLKDNEIWTQWATFFTKIGVLLRVFWRFVSESILNQKHRFGQKKHEICVPISLYKNVDPRTCGILRNFGRLTDVNRVASAPILHAPHSRMTCVCQRQTPSNY